MAKADVVYKEAAAWLNDPVMKLWTFGKLRPFLRRAFIELQTKLQANGISVIKKETSSPLSVTAGATTISLPSDLVEPQSLAERAAGTTDQFQPMFEKRWTPEISQGTLLRYWIWQEDQIKLLGATTDREVEIHYLKGLVIPKEPDDNIGIINGELFLGPATAGYAALSVGRDTLFVSMMGLAQRSLSDVVNMDVKEMQGQPVRRIPYRRRGRTTRRIY